MNNPITKLKNGDFKVEQERLLKQMMREDEKDGLYELKGKKK